MSPKNNNPNDEDYPDLTTDIQQPTIKTESSAIMECSTIGTLSEEELLALGIDLNEIRAQREIERRFEEEAKQQKYAEQLQAEFNREYSALSQQQQQQIQQQNSMRAESSTASTSTPAFLPSASESVRVASAPPCAGNQRGKRVTNASSSSSIVEINDENDRRNSPSVSRPVFPQPKPKRRRVRRYWLGPNETFPESSSDEEPPDMVEESSRISSSKRNLNNNNNSRSRSNNSRNSDTMPGSSHGTSGTGLGQSSTASDTDGLRSYHETPTPLSSLTTLKGVALSTSNKSTDEMTDWLATVPVETSTPPIPANALNDLDVILMKHQEVGFKWMYQQETSKNKGGLLCDDMGLGKTIQSLAIIVGRPCLDPAPLPKAPRNLTLSSPKVKPFLAKTTLIICPVNLMAQWVQEIKTKTKNLSVLLHHGAYRTYDPYKLAKFDAVVTSYNILTSELSTKNSMRKPRRNFNDGIFSVKFHRIILDEAHAIKNPLSQCTKACQSLYATHRWCLTATPIHSKLDDLYSLVRFLDIKPYDTLLRFRQDIAVPLLSKDEAERDDARKLFKAFTLRRSKKMMDGDQPVIHLPERKVHITYVNLTPAEQKRYDSVNSSVSSEINSRMSAIAIMRNHASLLALLLRLRQACLHSGGADFPLSIVQTTESTQMKNARSLNKKVVDRLLSIKNELEVAECPICMDIADQPRIIFACGHILCDVCLTSYINSHSCIYNGKKSCPECRGVLQPENVIPVDIFLKIHDTGAPPVQRPNLNRLEDASDVTDNTKIKTMLHILEKTRQDSNGKDKTIIFSQFASMLSAIGKSLNAMNIKFSRYDGNVAVAKRGKILLDFETDPSFEVLLISTKCGSVGLNLTMANKVIMMDIGLSPLLENQAIGRVHRIGQTKKVEVHRIIAKNTVEERILTYQEKKQNLSDNALDGGSKKSVDGAAKLGRNELLYLLCNVPLPDAAVAGPSS